MVRADTKRAWSADQRLEFIDFRLFWEGSIKRADLREKFGVSVPQASLDIRKYRESAPKNIKYDSSKKCYVAGEKFVPKFFEPNPARYLAQLRAIKENVISIDDTLMSSTPQYGILTIPTRAISAIKLRKLIQAIRSGRSVSIEYQSMNEKRPGPMWREITPHAFSTDGLRWHVRAYCHISGRFKDFIISRCIQIGELGEPKATGGDDIQWNSFFETILAPNPKFSKLQRQTIELDYGMENGACVVGVRHALLYYFDKRMRLDIPEESGRPQKTPIIVQNREAYDALLAGLFSTPATDFVV